jgi:type 1 fimbriae regulatory protein FimB/type 1 fimbriae regulatory protein FimE
VFVSERKAPLTPHTVRKIVARAGRQAGIEFPIHPHMLRHATGYKLANDGQDTRAIQQYLGHRNIQHTTRYTRHGAEPVQGFLAGLRLR